MTRDPDRLRLHDAGIRVDNMPPTGRGLRLAPDAEEREALAAALGISAVERLEVSLQAVKFRGGMRVTGQLEAEIVQPSVVSLEPVRQVIVEPIDRVFLPGPGKPAPGAEIYVDLEADDPPDHFEGPEADMSDLVIETLALAIDPYPRAEGESVETLGLPVDEDDEPSPFARLKVLKNPGDGG
ncbi:MAG TPA: DUF177 domain-containing protein [Devosiaceae bacterium]|jgi:uncharacterized metal-binding protein YceD (DUF177 family)|nr:DUF177 domain-containing protein [Devosiaceae bacterium]